MRKVRIQIRDDDYKKVTVAIDPEDDVDIYCIKIGGILTKSEGLFLNSEVAEAHLRDVSYGFASDDDQDVTWFDPWAFKTSKGIRCEIGIISVDDL